METITYIYEKTHGGEEVPIMEGEGEKAARKVVCVTGAGGFLASWLVKFLLSKGYTVHGTVRDPSDEKNAHLKVLEGAAEQLQLFQADILSYEAVRAAIKGCEGVFHAASPFPATTVPNPEVELIAPAVTGTLNVLRASSSEGVKRVVVVSSLASVVFNPSWPKDRLVDEDCWSNKEYCRNTENWYFLSKTMAEEEALQYGQKHGLDVVTLCPTYVFGPLLQPTANASSLLLIDILKCNKTSIENSLMHYVDVRDVADALLLVYEKPEASSRYICAAHATMMQDLVEMLKNMYPDYNYPTVFTEVPSMHKLTWEKLKTLGWKYMTLEETLTDSVESYRKAGLLT